MSNVAAVVNCRSIQCYSYTRVCRIAAALKEYEDMDETDSDGDDLSLRLISFSGSILVLYSQICRVSIYSLSSLCWSMYCY